MADPRSGERSDPVAADEPRRFCSACGTPGRWVKDRRPEDDAECARIGCEDRTHEVWHFEAKARSLSDSEPPVLPGLSLTADQVAELGEIMVKMGNGEWPQPALPSEPPPGYKSWADVDLELDEAEGDTGAEPERERAGDPLDVERLRRAMASDEEMFRLLWPDENGLDLAAERIAAEYARLSSQSPVASEETP